MRLTPTRAFLLAFTLPLLVGFALEALLIWVG